MAAPVSEGPRIRVAALILINGQIVLVRHHAGSSRYHLLPGGGVGHRETLAAALVREVREETGLIVEVGDLVLANDTIDPGGPRHVVNLTFHCRVVGGEITTAPCDPRVEAVDLATVDELASLDLRPPLADALSTLLSDGTSAIVYLGSLFTPGKTDG